METPKKLKMAIEKDQDRHIIKDIPLINTLTCTVEQGQYGVFIRLSRGSRWIVYSPTLWQKLVDAMVHNSKDFVKLTPEKQVKVVQFNDKRYVSFHRISGNFNTYINMNEEEWAVFKDKVLEMPCSQCNDVKIKKQLYDGKMMETKLSAKALENVKENNQYAYNQLAYQCEYCGDSFEYNTCHCHRYNCKECESDNFCSKCDELLVEGI